MKRIFILGTIGSGKTTLAHEISNILKIKHYDLDDIFLTKKFNNKRSEKQRDNLFVKLCNKKEWVIEGVYSDWIEKGIKKADLVILLDVSYKTLFWRISKRTLKKEKSKKKGKSRYNENFKDYIRLLRVAKKYKKKGFQKGYYKHREIIDKYKPDFIIIKNKKQMNTFLRRLK